jgi:hypothetical protein
LLQLLAGGQNKASWLTECAGNQMIAAVWAVAFSMAESIREFSIKE